MPVSSMETTTTLVKRRLHGLSALEAWGRKITTGYRDVYIQDLSTSWRDGLAFCAIIHHFRPDLIDYYSLSKENILYNNRLAFHIAKEHFSIPALLDAEDMLKHEEPDKRSIALYLSEYYNYFEGKRKLRPTPSQTLVMGSTASSTGSVGHPTTLTPT